MLPKVYGTCLSSSKCCSQYLSSHAQQESCSSGPAPMTCVTCSTAFDHITCTTASDCITCHMCELTCCFSTVCQSLSGLQKVPECLETNMTHRQCCCCSMELHSTKWQWEPQHNRRWSSQHIGCWSSQDHFCWFHPSSHFKCSSHSVHGH